MKKYYKIDVEEARAIRIKADATKIIEKEGIDGYAKVWLAITNTVRDNKKNDLFKTYNDYGNGIYIVCADDEYIVKSTKNYLESLGLEVMEEEEIATVAPEEVFNDDLEVELIEW